MSLLIDRNADLRLIERKLVEFSKVHARKLGLSVRVEPNLLIEAYDQAVASARFHHRPLEELSLSKRLAHVGYWIAELKPVYIRPPQTPEAIMREAHLVTGEAIKGSSAALTRAAELYRDAQGAYRTRSSFPISEYLSLEFIWHMLELEIQKSLEATPDRDYVNMIKRRVDNFRATLFEREVFSEIVHGLRYHVFTPRSFSTLVESLFAFRGV